MGNFDESKIVFETDTLPESVRALAQTVPAVMASACEEVRLCSQLLHVQQVRTADALSDPLLRVDYEFWTMPNDFDAAKPERVTYRREHLYVRVSVLKRGELFVCGLGPEYGFEEWFSDKNIVGDPKQTRLPEDGYAAMLQEITENHLNAIADYMVDDEESMPQGISLAMQHLYSATERTRRQANNVIAEQASRREAERQQAQPTWDPTSLHFVWHAEKLTLRLFSPERQFIWTASASPQYGGSNLTIELSKGRKVPSPLNYVPVSKATIKAPCLISPESAESELLELFESGWLSQQLANLS